MVVLNSDPIFSRGTFAAEKEGKRSVFLSLRIEEKIKKGRGKATGGIHRGIFDFFFFNHSPGCYVPFFLIDPVFSRFQQFSFNRYFTRHVAFVRHVM